MALDGAVAGESVTSSGRPSTQSPDSELGVHERDAIRGEDRDTPTADPCCWRVVVRAGGMNYHPIISAATEAEARLKAMTVMQADAVRGVLRLHGYHAAHQVANQHGQVENDLVAADLFERVPLEIAS
jgi:hypothetical protein